jgi:hypothetical protein
MNVTGADPEGDDSRSARWRGASGEIHSSTPGKEESYAACFTASSRLIHSASWFQLAKVRLTILSKR